MSEGRREVRKATIILEDADGNEWKLVADQFDYVEYSQFDKTEYGGWWDNPRTWIEQRKFELGLVIKNCTHFTIYRPQPAIELNDEYPG